MKKILIAIVVIILLFIGYRLFLAPDIYVMKGDSMEPTFPANAKMLVSADISSIKRGDVVVIILPAPNGQKVELVKRVVALPGESVSIKSGKILIDNTETVVSPITNVVDSNGTLDNLAVINLKQDEYFVLGDNTQKSLDSRHKGVFKKQDIKFVVTN